MNDNGDGNGAAGIIHILAEENKKKKQISLLVGLVVRVMDSAVMRTPSLMCAWKIIVCRKNNRNSYLILHSKNAEEDDRCCIPSIQQ